MVTDLGNVSKVQSRPNLSAVLLAFEILGPSFFTLFFFLSNSTWKLVACSSHPVFGVLSLQLCFLEALGISGHDRGAKSFVL